MQSRILDHLGWIPSWFDNSWHFAELLLYCHIPSACELESISAAFDSLYSRLSKLLSALSISLKYNSHSSSSFQGIGRDFKANPKYYDPIGNSPWRHLEWLEFVRRDSKITLAVVYREAPRNRNWLHARAVRLYPGVFFPWTKDYERALLLLLLSHTVGWVSGQPSTKRGPSHFRLNRSLMAFASPLPSSATLQPYCSLVSRLANSFHFFEN